MRKDMGRLLVERPRGGARGKHERRIDPRDDLEDLPSRGRMGRRWFFDPRDLGDRLAPLRRFLGSAVGRPWDDVWSEICAATNRRSIKGHHLVSHVHGLVYSNAEWWTYYRSRGYEPLSGFYVDDEGVLRRCVRKPRRRRSDWALERGLLRVGDDVELHLVDGVWYEVALSYVTDSLNGTRDAMTGQVVRLHGYSDRELEWYQRWTGRTPERYARGCLYEDRRCMAVSKRQLSKRELAEAGLRRVTA